MAKKPKKAPKDYERLPNDDIVDYTQTVSRTKLPTEVVYENVGGYDIELKFKKRPSSGKRRGQRSKVSEAEEEVEKVVEKVAKELEESPELNRSQRTYLERLEKKVSDAEFKEIVTELYAFAKSGDRTKFLKNKLSELAGTKKEKEKIAEKAEEVETKLSDAQEKLLDAISKIKGHGKRSKNYKELMNEIGGIITSRKRTIFLKKKLADLAS